MPRCSSPLFPCRRRRIKRVSGFIPFGGSHSPLSFAFCLDDLRATFESDSTDSSARVTTWHSLTHPPRPTEPPPQSSSVTGREEGMKRGGPRGIIGIGEGGREASNGKLVDGWGSRVAKSDAGIPCQHHPPPYSLPLPKFPPPLQDSSSRPTSPQPGPCFALRPKMDSS